MLKLFLFTFFMGLFYYELIWILNKLLYVIPISIKNNKYVSYNLNILINTYNILKSKSFFYYYKYLVLFNIIIVFLSINNFSLDNVIFMAEPQDSTGTTAQPGNSGNAGPSITVNNTISVNTSGVVPAASTLAGMRLGLEAAKHAPLGAKFVAAAAGGIAANAIRLGTEQLQKALEENPSNSSSNNFTGYLINNFNNLDLSKLFDYPITNLSDFPLSLIPAMDQMISAMLLILVVLFNLFIATRLKKIDLKIKLSMYLNIENSKLIQFILWYANKYINMWAILSSYILVYCWIILVIGALFLKLCLYIIIKNGITP